MQTSAASTGNLRALPAATGTRIARLRLAYTVIFRSRWKRLTWLVSAALFLVILLLTGAIATLPAPAQFSFPAGTVRFSWAKAYLWWVVTPHVMITLVWSLLVKAAVLALAYGMTIALAVARSRERCCRPVALGSAWLVFGSLGISFCCGPLVGLIGALGLASVATKLWPGSIGLLAATLLLQTMTLRPEKPRSTTEQITATAQDSP